MWSDRPSKTDKPPLSQILALEEPILSGSYADTKVAGHNRKRLRNNQKMFKTIPTQGGAGWAVRGGVPAEGSCAKIQSLEQKTWAR